MEAHTGKPAVWATAQYIATLYNPSEMHLDVACRWPECHPVPVASNI
jgi:hypothetical protein